jgi:hypothetical protein
MPAIASLEDLKAAQKDLCSMKVYLKRPARQSGFAQAGAILENIMSKKELKYSTSQKKML